VRQVVFYPSSGMLTLNVKFRSVLTLGQEIAVHSAKWLARHFGKEINPTATTLDTRSCLQNKSACLTARHRNRRCWVKGNRIGFAMNDLTVIAMADVLRHWRAGQLQLDDTATAMNLGDSHGSPRFLEA
jgi:hypothetical protein